MKSRVKWVENVCFMAESESGHAMIMDGSPDIGGRNMGPRPMEMLLMGAGGCTSVDVIMIMKKSRQDVTGCEVEVSAERATDHPKVFTKIHMRFTVRGRNLKPDIVERAIKLSAEKYCSASIILGKTAEMSHDFEIIEEPTAAPA
ncbi:MAG: OsmC family protein [Thiobacillaceae bacterium]|jgi:putative redox protein|nr:OsmC family protein [Thiobacillaceae bacterium]